MRKHGLWGLSDATFKRFNKEKKMNRYKAKELILKAFPKVSWKVNKFVQVEGIKSPFDGDIHYWSERNSKLYDGLTAKLLKKQGHKCSYCGYKFQTDEIVHLHHIDGNHNNWKTKNITVVHESCHDYIHMGKGVTKVKVKPMPKRYQPSHFKRDTRKHHKRGWKNPM